MAMPGELASWGAASFAASLALAICARRNGIAASLQLFDEPDGVRKRHRSAVPLVGGLAILLPVAVCVVAAIALGANSDRHLQLVLVLCSLGAGIVGFADDQTDLQAPTRILLLIIFASLALVIDPRLFPKVLHWGTAAQTAVWPSAFAALFVVAAVGIVNAVNMADGRDGLVGSMFAIWSLCLLIAGVKSAHFAVVGILGSSVVFLAYNLRGKLFLGDCGSYGVTFAIGIMAAAAHANGRIPLETLTVWFALPVFDCLRLIATRLRHGRSPFSGDREHLHHLLERRFGQRLSLVVYVGAIAGTSLLATIRPATSLACLIALALGFVAVTWQRRPAASVDSPPVFGSVSDEGPARASTASATNSLIANVSGDVGAGSL